MSLFNLLIPFPSGAFPDLWLLASLGFGVGILSGMLGIGGGLMLIPALSYLPGLFSLPVLSMHAITGLSATQSLAAGISGSLVHFRENNLQPKILLLLAIGAIPGAFLGGITTPFYTDKGITWVFFLSITCVVMINLFARPANDTVENTNGFSMPSTLSSQLTFGGICLVIGYICGLLGVGGAIYLIPLLRKYFNAPLRVAIGCGAGFVLVASIAGFSGKVEAGVLSPERAIVICVFALLGAGLGAKLSQVTPLRVLKTMLWLVLGATWLRGLMGIL